MMPRFRSCALLFFLFPALNGASAADENGFSPLFPGDKLASDWMVRRWDDTSQPAEKAAVWKIEEGVLHGSEPRGTWLLSKKEYGDFILEFEWKLGERGNSGTALRAPLHGDPAFDGMELQMVDPRYYGNTKVSSAELTGSLYKAVPPKKQVYKPGEWNKYQITCRGDSVKVVLNEEEILNVDLTQQSTPTKRHDGTDAPPLKDRPRKGHIGFQELSRGGGHVQIRHARIKELP